MREIPQQVIIMLHSLIFNYHKSLHISFKRDFKCRKNHFIFEIAALDMLKFSICFIAFISQVNISISLNLLHREKRFLIFPRANPTRHQVSFEEKLIF